MDAHENTPRIQVLSVSDTGRRRRWTDNEKVRIVEESHGDGVTLAEVARCHGISRSQLYDWRYRHKIGLLGAGPQFLRVLQLEGKRFLAPTFQPFA
jgi:transposase